MENLPAASHAALLRMIRCRAQSGDEGGAASDALSSWVIDGNDSAVRELV